MPSDAVQSISNGEITLSLYADATFSLQFGETDYSLSQMRATASIGGSEVSPTGVWQIDTNTARCGGENGTPVIEIALGTEAPGSCTMSVSLTPLVETVLDRFTIMGAATGEFETRLVEGYDSWSWAGVRSSDAPGRSWWRSAFVGSLATITASARTANRFVTAINWSNGEITIESAGAPVLSAIPDTWGFTAGATTDLGLRVDAGTIVSSEVFAFSFGSDPFSLVEADASATGEAMHARSWTGEAILGWESWYHFGLNVKPENVLSNARLMREKIPDARFDLVQIDDGWQKSYGAWWANKHWPDDMGDMVKSLDAIGCRAGLWLAPFMVVPDGPGLGTDHPDWCLMDPSTYAPLLEPRHNRWSLDASNPEVLEFLRGLGEQVRAWGFDMVKLDFLYFAAQSAKRHNPQITGTESLRLGLRAFIDGFGDDRYVLGCGMPMLPAVGLCHGNRIGHDTAMPVVHMEFGHPASDWTGYRGIVSQARNIAARWALQRRWFECDPDIVMAWGSDGNDAAGYSPDEARVLAAVAALCGGPCFLADDLAQLSEDEIAILSDANFLKRCWGDGLRPSDIFSHPDNPEVEHAFDIPSDLPHIWSAERNGEDVSLRFDWENHRISSE
ncbi:unannotated protein [freshwater metagenome]|uniref:Unannotated protein n=1 Tax=freshwater metagenome TaxID=449393 RepID=A0A6J7JLB3_9ZZZZ